jgi:hypothetical protein
MTDNDAGNGPHSIPVAQTAAKPLSRVTRRLLSLPLENDPETTTILFQHSVLCQTCMPYRDPGEDVRIWNRRNGIVHLEIQAVRVLDPGKDEFVDVGLPFGPKPRLVLYHLNAEALRTQSPVIELEDSLTAFVKRTLGLDPGGRNIKTVKHQLSRLAAADFRIGAKQGNHAVTIKSTIIEGLELWTPHDAHQRTLWPTTIQFSSKYFESLMNHAVPLNEQAVSRISHSAMALDIYTWLAQRLHRVQPNQSALVSWDALREHFGQGYARIRDFRRVFEQTLRQVKLVYPEALFSTDQDGMHLFNSRPPVSRRLVSLK